MSQFHDLQNALKEAVCQSCGGIGKCDDAELGDIAYREWTCHGCNGSGFGNLPSFIEFVTLMESYAIVPMFNKRRRRRESPTQTIDPMKYITAHTIDHAIGMYQAALVRRGAEAKQWKRLAFDLVRAAGGTQRISMTTALSAHTDDTLEVHHDYASGDMVYRVYRSQADTDCEPKT